MVRQAERRVKRSPLVPVFGLVIAIGLAAIAILIVTLVIDSGSVQQLLIFKDPAAPNRVVAIVGLAFVLWLAMLSIAYLLVALLSGRDPDDARKLELPPREVDRKKYRR